MRPDSAFVSKMRSAMMAGTSASTNASGENHASWFSPTSASV